MSKNDTAGSTELDPLRIWREWYQKSEKQWSDGLTQLLSSEEVAVKARATVDRAIQRHIPGLPAPTELTELAEIAELTGLGVEVGLTPKDIVHARGALKLYHYRPLCDEVYRVPILFDVLG